MKQEEHIHEHADRFKLRLYVNGTSSLSMKAIHNLKTILEEHLRDRYELEIVDAHKQPALISTENVTAIPMLVKSSPLPRKRLIGDMSDTSRVLTGLGLRT